MAARKRKVELSDTWKDGIRVSNIMSRLYGHALGEIEMERSQIDAAKVVLSKLVPDLARSDVNVSGDLTLTDALRAVNKSIDGEQ